MKRWISIVLAAAAVLLLLWSGAMNERLRALRPIERQGVRAAAPDTPPLVTFTTVALGGFRGLAADVLWARASELQENGRYFELAQLADWITRLEPRYTEVWAYHAWNMAYNISVMFPDAEDRWRWVQNGVRLVRDEGIPCNEDDPRLYWELGWLYLDKLGGPWDEAGLFYRARLATEMSSLLGGGHPDYNRIAGDPEWNGRLQKLGLLIPVMRQVDDEYGPLDWRVPESHAIYWAHRGRRVTPSDAWCGRVLRQGLLETFRNGHLLFDPGRGLYLRAPRLDLAARANAAYARDLPLAKDATTELAYENFLREAVLLLCVFDRAREAGEFLGRLRERVPATTADTQSFVLGAIRERIEAIQPQNVAAFIENELGLGYEWRAVGDLERAAGYERLARLYWEAGQKRAQTDNSAGPALSGTWATVQSNALLRAAGALGAGRLEDVDK
jgi:hypothetical protein